MKRSSFIRLSTLAALSPLVPGIVKAASAVFSDDELMHKLVSVNDRIVDGLLQSVKEGALSFSRKTAYDFALLAGSYCATSSAYYLDERLVEKMKILSLFLRSAQSSDGTLNVGNLESPPDTAFVIEIVCTAIVPLQQLQRPSLQPVLDEMKKMIQHAGEALITGGIHTPNHRWVVSAAMSQIHALWPDKHYVNRINDWLGEGIYQDADGHYPERSGTYSMVENTAFITLARNLNRPELLKFPRKNLERFYYHMEPGGDLVSNDSRRQDQYLCRHSTIFYLQYRYLAIRDQNRQFSAICKMIEATPWFEKEVLTQGLFYFLENSLLQQSLPEPTVLPQRYEKLFPLSKLLRIKQDNRYMTLFGGIDWPLIIASGRSCSPDIFSYRKGNAVLKYLRLSSSFFSMGYFYSDGLQQKGNQYVLHKKLRIPYYQPLPLNKRNKQGDYKLSPSVDDRFWNKMDFSNRPVSNVKELGTRVTLTEHNGEAELLIQVDGQQQVPVTIELCFKEGGSFTGLTKDTKGNDCLAGEKGVYTFEGEEIIFGPGQMEVTVPDNLEGERYSTHFGTLKVAGSRVFITGKTPFRHTLRFS